MTFLKCCELTPAKNIKMTQNIVNNPIFIDWSNIGKMILDFILLNLIREKTSIVIINNATKISPWINRDSGKAITWEDLASGKIESDD